MARGLLAQRIAGQHRNTQGHADGMRVHPPPPMPMVMPLSLVYMSGDAMVVEQVAPLWTNRGVVPATSAGRWDQVIAAGNV